MFDKKALIEKIEQQAREKQVLEEGIWAWIRDIQSRVVNIEKMLTGELAPPLVAELERILKGKQQKPVEMRATPVSEKTMRKLTKNADKPEIPTPKGYETITETGQLLIKRPHRRKRVIKGKRLKGAVANKIMREMHTDIVGERFKAILIEMYGRGHSTAKQIAESTFYSVWNTKAHLKYGIATGDITSKKKKYELRKYWLTKQGKQTIQPCIFNHQLQPTPKPELPKETEKLREIVEKRKEERA